MADAKICPKCNGAMTQGRIMRYNEYATGSRYMYVFAADNESGPDLSSMFSNKSPSKSRKALVAYSCDECGFTEFYGAAAG